MPETVFIYRAVVGRPESRADVLDLDLVLTPTLSKDSIELKRILSIVMKNTLS